MPAIVPMITRKIADTAPANGMQSGFSRLLSGIGIGRSGEDKQVREILHVGESSFKKGDDAGALHALQGALGSTTRHDLSLRVADSASSMRATTNQLFVNAKMHADFYYIPADAVTEPSNLSKGFVSRVASPTTKADFAQAYNDQAISSLLKALEQAGKSPAAVSEVRDHARGLGYVGVASQADLRLVDVLAGPK